LSWYPGSSTGGTRVEYYPSDAETEQLGPLLHGFIQGVIESDCLGRVKSVPTWRRRRGSVVIEA
jgi:hypothetical protein